MANRIRDLRRARGLTLEQLAEAVGTSYQQVMRLEKGERRLTVDWMVRIAPALGVAPADLMPADMLDGAVSGPDGPSGPLNSPQGFARPDLIPVMGAARGGGDQAMFLADGPIDRVLRPACLANVRDAYAIYVVGDSMSPRYRAGMLLHVNPYKPAKRESGVVVYLADDAVLIKELVEVAADAVILRQFNPAQAFPIPRGRVREWHTVVGTEEV
jgi:DNA-binding XRE family transcriptional regulator